MKVEIQYFLALIIWLEIKPNNTFNSVYKKNKIANLSWKEMKRVKFENGPNQTSFIVGQFCEINSLLILYILDDKSLNEILKLNESNMGS